MCNSHSTRVQSIPTAPLKNRYPQCSHRVLMIIMLQKWKVSCCITPVTNLILKYSSAAFLSTTNIIMELAHESSNSLKHKRPKLERGMQRECMASDIPVGWKGKNCWQHCTDRFAQLAMCFLFQLALGLFCWGRAGPDLFSYGRKKTLCPFKKRHQGSHRRYSHFYKLALCASKFVNKHQAPDMAKLWSSQLSPSTVSEKSKCFNHCAWDLPKWG